MVNASPERQLSNDLHPSADARAARRPGSRRHVVTAAVPDAAGRSARPRPRPDPGRLQPGGTGRSGGAAPRAPATALPATLHPRAGVLPPPAAASAPATPATALPTTPGHPRSAVLPPAAASAPATPATALST